MRVLLTGTAGFIGSRVAELLLDNGHVVFGVDNMCAAYDVRLKEHRLAKLQGRAGFTFEKLDISDRSRAESVWKTSGPFDAIVHLAARAGVRPSVEDPWIYIDTNVTGTLNLLELAKEHEIPKFVLASTSSLYGSHNPLPFSEDADTDRPLSPYAASKKGAESLCWTYHHLYGIDVSVLRYFTVYGPAGRPDMSLFRFVKWIYEDETLRLHGDGSQSRDFTYVDDIARGTVLSLRPLGFEVINLGSDHPHSLCEVIDLIQARVGRTARIQSYPSHPADVNATWASIDKARELLGWQPSIGLEEGVSRLATWYEQHRGWASQVETG